MTMRDAVALLAALRLTRLITRDWAGEWLIVRPAKDWAEFYDGPQDVHSVEIRGWTHLWRSRLVSGLDCPFCCGVWFTFGCLAVSRMNLPQPAAKLRDLILEGLAGSYIVGHISSRLDV